MQSILLYFRVFYFTITRVVGGVLFNFVVSKHTSTEATDTDNRYQNTDIQIYR